MHETLPAIANQRAQPREAVWLPAVLLVLAVNVVLTSLVEQWISPRWEPDGIMLCFAFFTVIDFGILLGYSDPGRGNSNGSILAVGVGLVAMPFVLILMFSALYSGAAQVTWTMSAYLGVLLASHGLFCTNRLRRLWYRLMIGLGITAVGLPVVCIILLRDFRESAGILFVNVAIGIIGTLFIMTIGVTLGTLLRWQVSGLGHAIHAPPVRRFLPRQYSLRSLFVLTTAAAVMAALVCPFALSWEVVAIMLGAAEYGIAAGIVTADVFASRTKPGESNEGVAGVKRNAVGEDAVKPGADTQHSLN